MSTLIEQVSEFILARRTFPTSRWFHDNELRIYVRVGALHLLPGLKTQACVDFANIVAAQPGNGAFSRFLEAVVPVIRESPYRMIYVENVLTKRFAMGLERRGFNRIPRLAGDQSPPSYFKVLG